MLASMSCNMYIKLFGRELILEVFQPMWSLITVPERHRQTDRQTTYCGVTALCVASRGKNRRKREIAKTLRAHRLQSRHRMRRRQLHKRCRRLGRVSSRPNIPWSASLQHLPFRLLYPSRRSAPASRRKSSQMEPKTEDQSKVEFSLRPRHRSKHAWLVMTPD